MPLALAKPLHRKPLFFTDSSFVKLCLVFTMMEALNRVPALYQLLREINSSVKVGI